MRFPRLLLLCLLPALAAAADPHDPVTSGFIAIFGIRGEFILFAATLLGVALLHRHALAVAGIGLAAIVLWCLTLSGFSEGHGFNGLAHHLGHEWVLLTNLLLLLTGFEILAHHVTASRLPAILPRLLPRGRLGAIAVLAIVFVLSAVLDNIAAALIGATIAATAFRGKVHVGYLAAIVAAANAGGAGSVVGDSTTTMIWLAGHSPLSVLHAYVGAVVAFLIAAWIGSGQQHRLQPVAPAVTLDGADRVDLRALGVVVLVLAAAIGTNLALNLWAHDAADLAPWIGLAVWVALIVVAPWRGLPFALLPHAAKGAAFLLCLVLAASCMPVAGLPAATPVTTAGLGLVSAVFDNIPLTALALQQGGYDWGLLAYAVGFGGSLIWFGSSAGVAVAGRFPAAGSTIAWIRHAWYLPIAYAAGIAAMVWMGAG
jgi:Na+/H+ antiporter NhaD/arsenite permease-like protein